MELEISTKTITIDGDIIDLSQFEGQYSEIIVKFNQNLTKDTVIKGIDTILDWEESQETNNNNIILDLKGFPNDVLIEVYKYCFKRETLINNSLLININLLINGYNTLDDSLFESRFVYVTNLEQLLDIKLELLNEIKEFQSNVTKWYLACLKSMHKVEYTYLDTPVRIPAIYLKIISSSNLLTLSQIFAKSSPINTGDLPLVEQAYPTIMSAASISAIADKLTQCFNDLNPSLTN